MKKKRKARKWIILGIVVILVVLAVVGFLTMRANLNEMAKTTYDIVSVEKGTIEVKVKGAGAVEPLVDETVYASFTGSVSEVLAENGDVAKADDVIAVFESDALDEQIDALDEQIDALETQIEEVDKAIGMLRMTEGSDTVRSPVAGTVKLQYAQEGDSVDVIVDMYGALAVVCPDELMQVTLPLADGVKAGVIATVTAGEKSSQGEIYEIDEDAAEMTVRFEDDGYEVGVCVTVTTENGGQAGSGAAEIANPVYISAQGGTIEEVVEEAGDEIKRGGNLYKLEGEILSGDLYAQIEQRKTLEADIEELEADIVELEADIAELTVKAGTDGVISMLDLSPDQIVQEGMPLFTVESNDKIKIDVEIDELDVAGIEVGQKAEVEFDALPEKMYDAEVVKINPVGVSMNNVTNFTITLEIAQDGDVMLGMSADVEIVSQRVDNVLVIPQEAIQIIDGEKFVVFEGDIDEELMSTPATNKIETGITDGVMIEVTSGLNAGDKVAVPQAKQMSMQEMQQQMMMRGNAGGNTDDETED